MVLFKAILEGRPGSKKNSNRYSRNGRIYKKEGYKLWEDGAYLQLLQQKALSQCAMPIKSPINLKCVFHLENHQHEPDTSNALQGPEDLLQKVGIIENDKQVYSFEGTRKVFGADRNFIEIEITLHSDHFPSGLEKA